MTAMTHSIEDVYAEPCDSCVHRLTYDLDARDQQDIAHDALARHLVAFPSGDLPANAAAWLEVAVRNQATDFLRRRCRRRDNELPRGQQVPDAGLEHALASLRGLRTPSLAPVRAGFLERLLGLLAPAAAEVLRLRFVDDLDAGEAARHRASRRGPWPAQNVTARSACRQPRPVPQSSVKGTHGCTDMIPGCSRVPHGSRLIRRSSSSAAWFPR
jgi:DNA-directed RNA polymerase specialized sigma24 family protein